MYNNLLISHKIIREYTKGKSHRLLGGIHRDIQLGFYGSSSKAEGMDVRINKTCDYVCLFSIIHINRNKERKKGVTLHNNEHTFSVHTEYYKMYVCILEKALEKEVSKSVTWHWLMLQGRI